MSEVRIDLAGESVTLRCTLRAAKEVNGVHGSFTAALRKVEAIDLAAMTSIIATGLGKRPSEVEEAVYNAGALNLIAPLSEYLTLLANGGRPVAPPDSGAAPGASPGER